MTNYSIAQIKALGQPPEVLNRRVAEHWSGPLYMRKISPYLSKILLKFGLSPTAVTWLMVFSGWIAALSVIKTGILGAVLAVIFAQLQMLFDCCDGEMARVTQNITQQESSLIVLATIQLKPCWQSHLELEFIWKTGNELVQ